MNPVADSPLLSVQNIVKNFGGIRAVIDGSLEVGRAEMIGLVGPNGCGKSTMLNVVSGLLVPDSGDVLFDGNPLPLGNYRATQAVGIRLVAQELAVAPKDTVWENIVLGAEPLKAGIVNRRLARSIAARALDLLGHQMPLNEPVENLTPVDRRLIMIARAAAHPHVRLLILDEPTAGLPHHEAERVIEAMKKLVYADRSLILVSHHIDDIVSACNKVTLMRDGVTTQTLEGTAVTKDAIVTQLLAGVSDEPARKPGTPLPETGDEVARFSGVSGLYLSDVNFTVSRGEVVGVAGILGSGASEIIQMLTGQVQPEDGEVTVGTAASTPSAPHKILGSGVGFVSGDRSSLVIKEMTVSEHVAMPALGDLKMGPVVSRSKERSWVKRSLNAFSVKGEPSAPMTSLSGGNQQRALMARWLQGDIELLVVDQPTVGVDIRGRMQLLGVLRDLATERGVIVAAEPDELAAICDRVLCLRRGKIAVELTGDEVSETAILNATS